MSQSLWQIGRPDLNAFFFFLIFFFWVADVSNLGQLQLWSVWNKELDLWMNKIQDWTQSWRSISVVSFYVYFDKQVHKKLEKN